MSDEAVMAIIQARGKMLRTKPAAQRFERSAATTMPSTYQWAVKAPNGQAAARLTTRKYQQEPHGHDFFLERRPSRT